MQAIVRAAFISVLGLAVHASAESRVCIGGDLDHLTQAEKTSCQNSADQIRSNTTKFHAPSDWHSFVVCTRSDWETYAAFSNRSATDLASSAADTDLQKHTTYFRGEWLLNANASSLNKTVAHEVASALLQSTDETTIQHQVALWLPEAGTKSLTLQASR